MQKELFKFIVENNLSPFNRYKTQIKNNEESIFKTRDAKSIHNKVLGKISENFYFSDTSNLLDAFYFTDNFNEIKKRQEFFKSIKSLNFENSFLSEIKSPEPVWGPKYDIVAVTANEKTFIELKKLGCPVKFITSPDDVLELETCDIIQAIDCEDFENYLEQLNQTISVREVEDVYLERYLETLSGWKKNLEVLDKNKLDDEMRNSVNQLKNLLLLISEQKSEKITRDSVEITVEEMNESISEKIKTISISGGQLFEMLSKNSLSKEILDIIEAEIEKTNLPEEIFNKSIPITIEEQELSKVVRLQDSNEFVSISEKIKKQSAELKQIPEKLKKLENSLLMLDFYAGISKFIKNEHLIPENSEEFLIEDSANIFLNNPQPVSFLLNKNQRCSILTGANSGGKTTLLEHIIQVISIFQMGLPISGKVKTPLFSEIYYFAKNKGSISKGAFETLLSQMAKINPGKQTLILADEIESVTEPGVAGKVLCATADYFIKKNCFLVIATHLGYEIQKNLPQNARIDGIEAKGLDENYELIVSHNPILGKLAHSTPELIIEKMARLK
ncbi:MAG: hypothetical protein Q8L27_01665 [archaeon]|nr:hypothetical protein [archaeon]